MIVVTVVVVAFVLFLMISALIRKQKMEFGILKAVGFKTSRLIAQLLISYVPALILGAAAGIVLGFTLVNPLLSLFLSGLGLPQAKFPIPALPAVLIGLGILGAGVLTIYLVALRLKKISPQKLIAAQ